MTPRNHRPRVREAQLAFEALSVEGGLLSPEWLAKVAQLQVEHQTEQDYRIPKGLKIRDEIGRYWRIAQAHWLELKAGVAAGADGHAAAERFALGLLRESFGFGTLAERPAPYEKDGRVYPVRHQALDGRVPVVIAPAELPRAGEEQVDRERRGLDDLLQQFGDGTRRRSAFGLAQEYLNANEDAVWGLATDGVTLRILRDNASLTRPAWIEADLARIFDEERYAEFAALWLLVHETRFGSAAKAPTECPLEEWRGAGREEGTRAREHLRGGVEEALVALGHGFLAHPENQTLRAKLQAGELKPEAYFQELLRLVYRLIFLLTAEERGVLHAPDATDAAKQLYTEGYGLRRLRDRSARRSAHDRFGDLWEALKIVLHGVATGESRLGLPALGGLFAASQCPHLDAARLENRALLTAVFRLAWLEVGGGLARVNWRDMGPEELGSVYESLLELVPRIGDGGRSFSFATGADAKGNARKTTGSYYTPDSLVQVLLDSALEPVVKDTLAAHPCDAAEALLRLAVVDPAAGSGHFLLAAARRLASHLARIQANGTPSAAEYRHALRQVVSRCIFGVDLNPMAVELCRVSLWMEAVEPGRPLSFLDSHIQCGNALLGTTPELMAKGIPDEAWEPIEGDDKKTASLLKKRNKAAAQGQRGLETLWAKAAEGEDSAVTAAVKALDEAPDADLPAIEGKGAQWDALQQSYVYQHQRFVADAWCAAFVWPKPPIPEQKAKGKGTPLPVPPVVTAAPTNDVWRQIRDAKGEVPDLTRKTVDELARQYRFFHWHLAFPQVFERGGFDVVLGNPPWERTAFEEIPFFSGRDASIADATTTAARAEKIARLGKTNPELLAEYKREHRRAVAEEAFISASTRYELSARGRTNTFALFADLVSTVIAVRRGRAGIVVPTAISTDIPMKDFWSALLERRQVVSLFDFENRGRFFPTVHGSYKFCLLTLQGKDGRAVRTQYGFFLTDVTDVSNPATLLALEPSDVRAVNPETGLLPVCRNKKDFELLLHCHRQGEPAKNRSPAWVAFTSAGSSEHWVHRADSSGRQDLVRLFESKLMHQFDHRFASFESEESARALRQEAVPDSVEQEHCDALFTAKTRFFISKAIARDFLLRKSSYTNALVVYRDLADNRSLRTMIATILPFGGALQPLNGVTVPSATDALCLVANLNAFIFDYVTRLKTPGMHVNVTIFNQLPVLPCSCMTAKAPWGGAGTVRDWVKVRALELIVTAWDLEALARDAAYEGPPFRWDPERRSLLRAELDAAFFHLYGISRDDTDYIMETFPIVKKNDEKAHGEYRTKRVILEIYDAMAEAIRTGKPYETRLDPPPADPRVAHAAKSRRSA